MSNPHDLLFKKIFSHKQAAASFFEYYLPASTTEHLDVDSLKAESTSFVHASLAHRESDLLFRANIRGTQAGLYLLFEHQKTPDRWMPFRLLSYMVAIWQRWQSHRAKGEGLPPIIPIVLYQGEQRWTGKAHLEELVHLPEPIAQNLSGYVPHFSYELIDLGQIPHEHIRGNVLIQLTLGLMKAVGERKVRSYLDEYYPLFAEVLSKQADSLKILEIYFSYLANVDSSLDHDYFESMLAKIDNPSIQTQAMTLVDQWLEQGREQGLEQGREQGLEQGQLIGQINVMQRLLSKEQSSATELSLKSEIELRQLLTHLEKLFASLSQHKRSRFNSHE